MTVQVIDYKSSVPSSVAGGGVIAIPTGTPVQIADLGVYITPSSARPNRVELIATVGVRALVGISDQVFYILRDGVIIFTAQQSANAATATDQTATVQTIDFEVSNGFHVYTLQVQNVVAGTTSEVLGPITFSALALGPVVGP